MLVRGFIVCPIWIQLSLEFFLDSAVIEILLDPPDI